MPNSTPAPTQRGAGSTTALLAILVLCAASWLAPSEALADAVPARVTAVIGDARGGEGRSLSELSAVGESERVVMGEDGKCSMLVDGNVVIQLCERTTIVLRRDRKSGRRTIHVAAGTVRVIAEPRLASERIEIHTPVAIATLLGTIAHVTVDPETQASVFSSMQSSIGVRAIDDPDGTATQVNSTEQITVRRGQPVPKRVRRMDAQEMTEMIACVADLHQAAIRGGREGIVAETFQRLSEADRRQMRRLGVGSSPAKRARSISEGRAHPDDPSDPDDLCAPTDCGDMMPPRSIQLPQDLTDGFSVTN